MCLADDADDDRTLLHCFLCILDLEYAALRRERHRIVVVVVPEHVGGGPCGGEVSLGGVGEGCPGFRFPKNSWRPDEACELERLRY